VREDCVTGDQWACGLIGSRIRGRPHGSPHAAALSFFRMRHNRKEGAVPAGRPPLAVIKLKHEAEIYGLTG
jgi:hypothetical protein